MPASTILIVSVADVLIRLLLFTVAGLAGFLWLLHAAAARSASIAGKPSETPVSASLPPPSMPTKRFGAASGGANKDSFI